MPGSRSSKTSFNAAVRGEIFKDLACPARATFVLRGVAKLIARIEALRKYGG